MAQDVLQKFNVTTLGHGAQTLVFAHGFGSDQTAWRHQVAAFITHYRIVLFDYLGCGKSDLSDYSPLHYDSLESYKDDLLAIYEALNLTDSIFVGHSASATVGMLASRVHPARFRKMVFIGASPRYLNETDYVGGFEQADLNALYDALAADYLGWANGFASAAMGNPQRPELGREFARSLSAMRPDIAQSTARMIFESDFRAQLPHIEPPVLILQSTRDMAVPMAVGDYLSATIPHSHLVVLNAEGHFPHLSAPQTVISAIQDFLDDTRP